MKKILSILILIVFFILSIFLVLIYQERCQIHISKALSTLISVQALSSAIRQYEKDNGITPKDLHSLAPKYLKRVMLYDSWGYKYHYKPSNPSEKRVFSLGSDGKKGGKGAAMDFFGNLSAEYVIHSIPKPVWGCNR